MKAFLCFLAIFILFISQSTLVGAQSFSNIADEVREDIARPGVSPFRLHVTDTERVVEGLRVQGSFEVSNEKETTSSEIGYVIYSGEILGSKGIQRPTLPQEVLGSFVLDAQEIREIDFDILLPDYFGEMHNGIELSLINERGFTFKSTQAEIFRDDTEFPRGKVLVQEKDIILNRGESYDFRSGITLYTNEDRADIKIVLKQTNTPVVVIPEISYFERTYFSQPALVKKYTPVVTQSNSDTEITLPVTLTRHNLSPTIYPFELRLDIQGDGFADPTLFGRLTLGGVSAKVINIGFNNERVADVSTQERLDTLEISIDGALPDLVEDRRRQRSFDADVHVTFYDEGEVVYQDSRSTKILANNELVFVLQEKLRPIDFDQVEVRVLQDSRVLDVYNQSFEHSRTGIVTQIALLIGVLLILGFVSFSMKKKEKAQQVVAGVCLLILGSFFIGVEDAEAGARDYYDNRLGCERIQNSPDPNPNPDPDPDPSGSGSGDDDAVNPWFLADEWVNKWVYIDGDGDTFGHGVSVAGLSAEEAAELPDVRTVEHNLRGPAQGCYQPGEVVELQIQVSIAVCSNSAAGSDDDVDEVSIFQLTTGADWYIDYNGEYDPEAITTGDKTKPCPDGNDKTFGVLHRGDPSFEEMHDRKRGWTVLTQGENTTQGGGDSINETKTIFIQMPYEPGTYTLGTRLTVDPTKGGGIVESKESIPVAVCDNPRDMCYLIEGLQYIDTLGLLRDASANEDSEPNESIDPYIHEYVIQYADHQKLTPGFFDTPTPESFGPKNDFTLQTVCNLCPNPLRPTLPLGAFSNRKDAWKDVSKADVDAHELDLIVEDTGADGFEDDIDRRYSEIEYQGLYTDGGAFTVESGATQINDAIIQHHDNGEQIEGNQSRLAKGVLWRNFFKEISNFDSLVNAQTEIEVLGIAASLKEREAELLLDIIHLWTDSQGNEHYAEPFGEGGVKVTTGLVPAHHILGGGPDNHAGEFLLYQDGDNPLVPYDTNGHYHTHYVDILRGIDSALRSVYTSPYDPSFVTDSTTFRDTILTQYHDGDGVTPIEYDLKYPDNVYLYSDDDPYTNSTWDDFFTDQMKSTLVQKWLMTNYASASFDGCFSNGDCFSDNTDTVCLGGTCSGSCGGSCDVSKYYVDDLQARARTFDTYYANEPIHSTDGIDAYNIMKNTIWTGLIGTRAAVLSDMQEYRKRQVALLREFEDLPPFFESVNVRKWPLVENYRLYREQIDLPFYDPLDGYSLDTSYLASISGIDPGNFTEDQIRTYKTYIKAYFDDEESGMQYLSERIDTDESSVASVSKDTGLHDGDTSDVHIIQLIQGAAGNERTCIAFEDICSDVGIQSAFLKSGDPNTVELYEIDEVTAEKIDSDTDTPEIDPRKSMSLATASVTAICDQTPRPVCPNDATWDYDTITNTVYEKDTDTATGALYDATKDLCLTQCVAPASPDYFYDSADVNTSAQAVYDTTDAGTTALADWFYDSTTAATCEQDACPTIGGQQGLIEGSSPAQAQDVGGAANSYFIAVATGGGTQCVDEVCAGSGLDYNGGTNFWNDGGIIRNLAGDDTGFTYDSGTDTCTPATTDVCLNLDGDQATPPEPPAAPGTYTAYTHAGNPNYCDYCATNLSGIQNASDDGRVHTYDVDTDSTTEEKGWFQQPGGTCTSDRCFTEPGNIELYKDLITGDYNQVSDDTPTDYVLDGTGYCHLDVCENVDDSLQLNGSSEIDVREVPDGYVDNGDGTCSQVDVCLNIPGAQASIPSDYAAGSIANTCDFCNGVVGGRPDVVGVQHIQDGSYDNSGGVSPGVLDDATMYEYVSSEQWTIESEYNTQTCEPLICPNINGGDGFTESGGDIEYNGAITDLEFTTGYQCACSDNGIASGDEACYDCLLTGYLNKSLGGGTCPARPDEPCQVLPGGGTVLISGEAYHEYSDGQEVESGGVTYRLGTNGSGRTCTEASVPTFELTTTPGFININEDCDIELDAINVDQCRITLLNASFEGGNSCNDGDGSSGDKCIIPANETTKVVDFDESLEMTTGVGSVLVVAECAPEGALIDLIIDESEYTLETESECRIPPNIGEF